MGILGSAVLAASLAAGILCLVLLCFAGTRECGLKVGLASALLNLLAAVILLCLLVAGDFSIKYVYENTDKGLPLIYKISALWSGRAGSLLLWTSGNSLVYLGLRGDYARRGRACATSLTAVMTLLNSAFMAGLLFADNPFKPAAAGGEGFGLSPSLQSLGMVFHPPLVMAAYSFLFAAFAERLGLAAGYAAGPDGSPRSASRTALLGWLLLTAGIAGGGIWAYTELGWGGYWSWDPIETSAMSVWLLLSAYLHAGGKEGERGRLSLVLISATVFAVLSGTFIARSGVLESVHAYSAGAGAKAFPLLAAILAVPLFLLCAAAIKRYGKKWSGAAKAERLPMLLPPALLSLCALALLLAELSPLLPPQNLEISEKTYDSMFALFGLPLLVLAAVHYAFGSAPVRKKALAAAVSLSAGLAVFFLPAFASHAFVTRLTLAVCCACLPLYAFGLLFDSGGLVKNGRRLAGCLLHLGLLVFALGLVGSRGMKLERVYALSENSLASVGGLGVKMISFSVEDGPEIKKWTTGLLYDDGGGGPGRTVYLSLQYYKKRAVYQTNTIIIGDQLVDVCLIDDSAHDAGTGVVWLALFKWVPLLWLGLALMLAACVYRLLFGKRRKPSI